jgi:hypothetical protein
MDALYPAEKPVKRIKQGGSGSLTMQFATPTGGALDISTATEIVVQIPTSTPGSPLVYKLSLSQVSFVGTGAGGKASIQYSAADSNSMIGSDPNNPVFQNFQATITIGGKPIVVQFLGQLIVDQNLFP